jgi:hypothetical protein
VHPKKGEGTLKRTTLFLLAALAATAAFVAVALASGSPGLTNVPAAQPKAIGYAPASQLSTELRQSLLVQGSTPVENPQGVVTHYGYENDTPSSENPNVPQMIPIGGVEAQKTEPDKNTYLVLKGQTGADANYDYGTHFVFQGHENGAPNSDGVKQGYITRVNLDADTAHRVTVMATKDNHGAPIATIDGSTWDPFAQRLLFTTENTVATYAATLAYPSTVEDVSGALGKGGYEGIQNDGDGNIWIVEDIGGATKPVPADAPAGTPSTNAKVPNSFIYRYVPAHRGDLHNGKLQALQVLNDAGKAITQSSQTAINAPDQVLLHKYGVTLRTQWVTVHDTAVDGNAPFNANATAKAKSATPFKRPENGVFRPGTRFGEFFFTETGDTNATSVENDTAGGWGSLFRLVQSGPSASTGKISVFFRGNQATTGLDNIQFLSKDWVLAVEDAGDTLHTQRHALDSGFAFDTSLENYLGKTPVRWLAEGRDFSAATDSLGGGFGKNDGDNEITGVHVSDGDPGTDGILGAKNPDLSDGKWRWFYTQQHGDNNLWEVSFARQSQGNG